MNTYKNLECLRKRAIKNVGKPVKLWHDSGIKVGGKIYRQMEYGHTGYNFTGNMYVIFRNTGKKGAQKTYANRENFTNKDTFIRIDYDIKEGNLFEFLDVSINDYY